MYPETRTRKLAIRIAQTLATPSVPIKVFRLWHPQAQAEQVALLLPN